MNRVLLDAIDVTGKKGGKVYEEYGVRPEGAVVVIRPDGYVASITSLDKPGALEKYFANFLKTWAAFPTVVIANASSEI